MVADRIRLFLSLT